MPGETAEPHPPFPSIPAGILVYDGDCGFCTATARWVERRLSHDYQVVPSQKADLDALGLTDEAVARSAWWIDPSGSRVDEHQCIAAALRAMSGPWPAVGRIMTLGPVNPLARCVYRLVANNRSRIRWPGATKCDRR